MNTIFTRLVLNELSINISNSIFVSCFGENLLGGAVYVHNTGTNAEIHDCTFCNCSCTGIGQVGRRANVGGGGIMLKTYKLCIERICVEKCFAKGCGGGFHVEASTSSSQTIQTSTVVECSSDSFYGAFGCEESHTNMNNINISKTTCTGAVFGAGYAPVSNSISYISVTKSICEYPIQLESISSTSAYSSYCNIINNTDSYLVISYWSHNYADHFVFLYNTGYSLYYYSSSVTVSNSISDKPVLVSGNPISGVTISSQSNSNQIGGLDMCSNTTTEFRTLSVRPRPPYALIFLAGLAER